MTEPHYAARITPMGKAYVEWVTSLDTEPPLEGAFNAGWRAREGEIIERLETINELLCDGYAGAAGVQLGEFLDELKRR